MKKLLPFLPLLFILAACTPATATAQFVQLPEAETLGITALVVAIVGWIFTLAGSYIPWANEFLSKYKDEIAVTLAATVVGVVENALPSAYPELSLRIVQLVIAAIASFGLFKFLGKKGVKSFKA